MAKPGSELTSLSHWLRDLIRKVPLSASVLRVRRHTNVYASCDTVESVFMIESGRIKLVTFSATGKECLLGLLGAGELFGELSLAQNGERLETATAVQDSIVTQIPAARLLASLSRNGLAHEFVRYLAERLAERQQIIARLLTVDAEHRLAATLLELGRRFGRPHRQGLWIDFRISHQELSQMVGTTRPRITAFMTKFQSLGLIQRPSKRSLIVNEAALAGFLDDPERILPSADPPSGAAKIIP